MKEFLSYYSMNVSPILTWSNRGPSCIKLLLNLRWNPLDAGTSHLNKFHQLPLWLISTGGNGLMENISKSASSDAEQGRSESVFMIEQLALRPERWGDNVMTKFVYQDKPIGVWPFTVEIFEQMISILGFESEWFTSSDKRFIKIKW